MELFWYGFLFMLTLLFCVQPNVFKHEKAFFLFWYLIACLTSVVIRLHDIDILTSGNIGSATSDITAYSLIMKNDDLSFATNGITFVREPIVWFSLRGLYRLLENEFLTFIVFDCISFYFLYKALALQTNIFAPIYTEKTGKKFNIRYVYFGLFLFFPFTIGMHTTYRQLISTIFVLYAIGCAGNKKVLNSFIFFLISVLCHNSAGLFLPIVLYMNRLQFWKILSVIFITLTPVLFYLVNVLPYRFETQRLAGVEAGKIIDMFYAAFFALIFLGFYVFSLIKKTEDDSTYLTYAFYLVVISISASVMLSSTGAERLGMFMCALLYPIIAIYIETKFKQKVMPRLAFFSFSALPALTFYWVFV